MQPGEYYELEVVKEVDFGVYLLSEIGELLLPTKYVPVGLKIGDMINVFVYRDSEDRFIATTLKPKAKLNEFASMTVADINDYGAFMEWGLEKDLFVPNKEQHRKFRIGNQYVIRVCLDHQTNRLIGVGKLKAFFQNDPLDLTEGQEVDLLIYNQTDLGFMAVINQAYQGLIYGNEIFQDLEVGQQKKGFVKKLREDGKIDLTLNPPIRQGLEEQKQSILNKLQATPDKFLAFNDRSDAEDIVDTFQMSKKAFKRALGGLYKDRLISIEPEGIRLI